MTVSLTYRHLPDSDTRFLDLVKNLSFFIGIVVKRKVFENVVSAYVVWWLGSRGPMLHIVGSLRIIDIRVVGCTCSRTVVVNVLDVVIRIGKEVIEQSLVCIEYCWVVHVFIWRVLEVETWLSVVLRLQSWLIIVWVATFCVYSHFDFKFVKVDRKLIKFWVKVCLHNTRNKRRLNLLFNKALPIGWS